MGTNKIAETSIGHSDSVWFCVAISTQVMIGPAAALADFQNTWQGSFAFSLLDCICFQLQGPRV